ncbi:MAG: type I-D CRISPR-associated protein Cas5/Csc1 [Thermoflexales bacterium]|nr:type I-D CRISPR-associated protein Cas5/Csc1 [Thermoflexales bacterium]
MIIYMGRLVLHESLYFATREVGRLYETGRYLHNYALTYALGLAVAPYFNAEQVPRYAEQLVPLNERGIYVTPARGVKVSYALATFKYANNAYHVEMEKGSRNTPSFGRAKELAVGSEFEFAVLSEHETLSLPGWIRLGLWRSKAAVTWNKAKAEQDHARQERASLPLNPLDTSGDLMAFDLISMPPSSLVDHALMLTEWWTWQGEGETYRLPVELKYTFPNSEEVVKAA